MARYIDIEKLKGNIRVNLMPNVDIDGTVAVENAERYFLNLIEKTTTADVVEVKHGYWKDRYGDKYHNHLYECSVCGKEALYEFYKNELDQRKERQALTPICPYCSAKMYGGKQDGTL